MSARPRIIVTKDEYNTVRIDANVGVSTLPQGSHHFRIERDNHFDEDGRFIVEQRTMFQQVGWRTQSGVFHSLKDGDPHLSGESFSPVYVQVDTDRGDGWQD